MKILLKIRPKYRQKKQIYPEKGFVLATTLIIFLILSVLSASYLISVNYDARFAQMRTIETQAIFMARSGIKYYTYIKQQSGEQIIKNETIKKNIDFCDGFEVNAPVSLDIGGMAADYIMSAGIVYNLSGKEIARETIIAPFGEMGKWRRYKK